MGYQPSVRDVILAFFRRRTLFMLVCGAVFLTGGAYLLLKQPLYQSTASLVLHFDTQAVPNIDRTMNPTQPLGSNEHREILYSDSEIMRSTGVIHGLITAMGIARLYPHIAASQVSDIRKLDLATESLLANLVVDVGLQSDVLNINYFNPDPTVARDTVQGLLNKFFDQEAAVYANPQITFAENEAAAARDKLTAAQNNLAQFKSQNKIADLQQQVSQFLLSRTDVESRLRVAQGRVLEAENRQKALKELLDTVPANSTSSAMGEQYHAADSAESQLDQLRAKRSQLASSYRAGSEVFQQLDAQIASLSSAARSRAGEARGRSATQPNLVYQSIKTDYLRAAAEASSAHQPADVLTQQLAQINARLTDLETLRNQYDDLTRAVQIQNDTYKTLAIRYETARVEANRNAQKISAAVVIAAPTVGQQPARPRRKVVALATLLAALVLGCASVLAVEGFDDRFRTPRDVTRILRLPVLATFAQNA
jgi:uncharacterized protein involved in exopolysaccharide biosynthesis